MRRSLEICCFELALQLRSGSNYVYFVVLALLAALVTLVIASPRQEIMVQGRPSIPTLANAPVVVWVTMIALALLALLGLSGGLFARSATRDFEAGFFPILVTSGAGQRDYILGRLGATIIVAAGISLGIVVGLLAALLIPPPLTDPAHIGPLSSGQDIIVSGILYGSEFCRSGPRFRHAVKSCRG
jgi:hypothetical protein